MEEARGYTARDMECTGECQESWPCIGCPNLEECNGAAKPLPKRHKRILAHPGSPLHQAIIGVCGYWTHNPDDICNRRDVAGRTLSQAIHEQADFLYMYSLDIHGLRRSQ